MRISLNDTVEFSLTEYGAEVWNKHYADFPNPYRTPATAGPMSEPLWVVMRILGPSMRNGGRNSIESTAIETRSDSADQRLAAETKQLEAKLAAYTEAFARAQRALLDAAEFIRVLKAYTSPAEVSRSRIATMIDACSLAAMNPGVVKHCEAAPGELALPPRVRGVEFTVVEATCGGWLMEAGTDDRSGPFSPDCVRHGPVREIKSVAAVDAWALALELASDESGFPWSVGAGRLSVELHALTDLLALARSVGAEVGSFTVHELARIAGDLHASSYVEHSIALNKIHALLNNMPEPTGPMTSGSEAAVSSTIERVRLLVDVLRKATDALVAGGAA